MGLRVLGALWRASILTAVQYRSDFLLNAVMGLLWSAWTVAPLVFVYEHTQAVSGWSYPQALLVLSFFLCLRGILDGFIDPNLRHLVEQVRDGTLDFVLLKPADAQIMVSFGRIVPGRVVDVAAALGVAVWSLRRMGHVPGPAEVGGALLCLVSGVVVLYSIWLLAASTSFWWVRVESLSFLLGALLDAGRWPIVVYRGWIRVVLTFVLPVTLMTSFPALALQGALEPARAVWAVVAGVGFLALGRFVWRHALSHYTSASS
jgi:ABC-2 type transport system permease protein